LGEREEQGSIGKVVGGSRKYEIGKFETAICKRGIYSVIKDRPHTDKQYNNNNNKTVSHLKYGMG